MRPVQLLEPLLGPLWPLLRPFLEPLIPSEVLGSVEAGRGVVRAVTLGLPLVAAGGGLIGFGGRAAFRRWPRLVPAAALLVGLGLTLAGAAVYGASVLGAYPAAAWAIGGLCALLGLGLASLGSGRRRGL